MVYPAHNIIDVSPHSLQSCLFLIHLTKAAVLSGCFNEFWCCLRLNLNNVYIFVNEENAYLMDCVMQKKDTKRGQRVEK